METRESNRKANNSALFLKCRRLHLKIKSQPFRMFKKKGRCIGLWRRTALIYSLFVNVSMHRIVYFYCISEFPAIELRCRMLCISSRCKISEMQIWEKCAYFRLIWFFLFRLPHQPVENDLMRAIVTMIRLIFERYRFNEHYMQQCESNTCTWNCELPHILSGVLRARSYN